MSPDPASAPSAPLDRKDNFVHLHVHTEYSMLDGAARIGELFARSAEMGMPALATTDHGYLFALTVQTNRLSGASVVDTFVFIWNCRIQFVVNCSAGNDNGLTAKDCAHRSMDGEATFLSCTLHLLNTTFDNMNTKA